MGRDLGRDLSCFDEFLEVLRSVMSCFCHKMTVFDRWASERVAKIIYPEHKISIRGFLLLYYVRYMTCLNIRYT